MDNKDVATRIEECKEIKKQLQTLGALLNDQHSKKISKVMNDFLKYPQSQNLRIPLDSKYVIYMTLIATKGRQSGVTLNAL